MPSTSNASNLMKPGVGGMLKMSNILEEDLYSASSESDPFGGDDEDKDPDFQIDLPPKKKLSCKILFLTAQLHLGIEK